MYSDPRYYTLADCGTEPIAVTIDGRTYNVWSPAAGFLKIKGHGVWRSEAIGDLSPTSSAELRGRLAGMIRRDIEERKVTASIADWSERQPPPIPAPPEPWLRGE